MKNFYKKDEEKEDYGEDREKRGAVFNSGISLIMRLDSTLRNLTFISAMGNTGNNQELKIGLVKFFFVQAAPLLEEKFYLEYDKITKAIKPHVINEVSSGRGTGKVIHAYSYDLDNHLNDIVIKIQRELQKTEKLFMPSSKDPKHGWSQE